MKTYELSEELINQILGYLGGRPFNEVATLIARIVEVLQKGKQ